MRAVRRAPAALLLPFAALAAACAKGDGAVVPTQPITTIAPSFTTQPTSLIATLGTSARLVAIPSGSTPLTVQWYHNGAAISGATGDTLKIATVAPTDSGRYFATGTNSAGVDTSNVATITVVTAVSSTALRQIGGAGTSSGRAYRSDSTNESAMLFLSGAVFLAFEPAVVKNGNTSSLIASRDVGTNAAVRAASGSRLYVTAGIIASSASGAAAAYASGSGSRVALTGGLTNTHGGASPLFGASDGGDVSVSGGIHKADSSDAIVVGAPSAAPQPVTIAISGGATITTGTGVLLRVTAGAAATLTLKDQVITGSAIASTPGSVVTLMRTQWIGGATGIGVSLDSTSVWTVTGNSAVTTLAGANVASGFVSNIVGNGFSVTYDATAAANAALAGRSWPLSGGGTLSPR